LSPIKSIVRRDVCLLLLTACAVSLPGLASAQTAGNGTLLISEFRLRGPSGAQDEFIEIYNNTDASHTVVALSGTGYGIAASDGVTRCSIPNGTVMPARGHYLCVNSATYSLGAYPAGTGNATYTTDIPDNAGIALFNNNTGGGSYSLANRIDAAGSTSEANTVYKEGTGYPALTPFSIDYSFARKLSGGCTGSGSGGSGNCSSVALIQTTAGPISSKLLDTNNNANDFIFVDTNGTSAGAGQRLGAPGPENSTSPTALDGTGLLGLNLDPCVNRYVAPNVVRDFTSDPANNSTFGTLDVRRTFTNNSGAPITRLRFRIVDITTFPSISSVADLRPRTSTDVVVSVDRPPCGSGTSNPTVHGTTLEQPPAQPNGSGYNGSLSVGAVSAGTPLAAGASIDVRFLLGIQQTGAGRFCVAAETIPTVGSEILCVLRNTEGTPHPSVVTSDFDGNGASEIAVFRPSTGEWFIQNQATLAWGAAGDIPVAGDYNGDGLTDRAVYRPSTGTWYVDNQSAVVWGAAGDIPVPGDYLGAASTRRAVYRPSTGTWYIENQSPVVWGAAGDIPVPGDYNGDHVTDIAVYRPSTGTWYVQGMAPVTWGSPGDMPVPGDYNGNGTTDIAVFRPSTGVWYVAGQAPVTWGAAGDMPVPGDYNGNATTDIAVFRPSTGVWFVAGQAPVTWGAAGDLPVPRPDVLGDFNGDGTQDSAGYLGDFNGNLASEFAVYRPSTGTWYVQGMAPVTWGSPGDMPVPGDYNGNGTTDIAVFRPSTGVWYVPGQAPVTWGAAGDIPVPGDYNGNGTVDIAVYRPSTSQWFIAGQPTVIWGAPGDVPVPGDYDGNGTVDIAVYRPLTGFWYARTGLTLQWGAVGDIPVPGDYDGNGTVDIAVYRPSTGQWFIAGQPTVTWGAPGDLPVPGDFDGNGTRDIAVYRPSTGFWYVRGGASAAWGAVGDIPASRAYVPR
jgi:hypothetical protein